MLSLFWVTTPWQVLQYPHTIFDLLPYRLYPLLEMLALAQKITQMWTRQIPGALSGHPWLLCQRMWEALIRVSLNKQNSISFDIVAVMTINFHFAVYPSWSGRQKCTGEWWLCSEDCRFWSRKGHPLSWLLPQNNRWPTACEMDGPRGSVPPCIHNTVRCVSS